MIAHILPVVTTSFLTHPADVEFVAGAFQQVHGAVTFITDLHIVNETHCILPPLNLRGLLGF